MAGEQTRPVQASSVKEGGYLVIEGAACQVSSVDISRAGKHGPPKVRIVGVGLLDGRKRELVLPGGATVEVPIVEKRTAQVLSVVGQTATVMDSQSYESFELTIPQELAGKIAEGMQVLYWIILGQKVLKGVKG